MNGPESWKTKCSIRRVDDVAMTEKGTLILRRDSLPPMHPHAETLRFHPSSIAPFAIDISDLADEEDHLPPARNSDALGLRFATMNVSTGSVTRGSFLAGLSAGLTVIAVAGALAIVSFTSDYASHSVGRSPRIVAHGHASLTVAEPETAVLKAAPVVKHRVKRVARVAEETPVETAVETPESE